MNFLKYHLPLLGYAGIIFWVSSIPDLTQPFQEFYLSDKLLHLIEFMILGWLGWRSARHLKPNMRPGRPIFLAFVIGALYAGFDEYHQSLVPGRSASIYDWIADITGLAGGIALSALFKTREGNPCLNI